MAVADALLARGAPVDAAKLDGSTALHLCAARHRVEAPRGLLDHGADPSRRTVSGSSPLDRARLFRDDRLARVLALADAQALADALRASLCEQLAVEDCSQIEITGMNTKQIVSQLNKMRKRYREFQKDWDNGEI